MRGARRTWRRRALASLGAGLITLAGGAPVGAAAMRVFSLDQCADQYVIALAPRDAIVGVSPRVDALDSYLGGQSQGLPRRRATAEAVLGAGASVVVREWGGDDRLARTLAERNIQVLQIDEAENFADVRKNIRKIAAGLGRSAAGEQLIARMDAQLAAAAGAWNGREALYLTPGGVTAGSGTLVDAILRSAGLRNLAPGPYFPSVSLEQLVMHPPSGLVLGFFDGPAAGMIWSPGRSPVVRRLAAERALDSLPAAVLGCPAWFAAEASRSLADKASPARR